MKLSLNVKKVILILLDICLINLAYFLAFAIRFEFDFEAGALGSQYWPLYKENMIMITAVKLAVFYLLGLYHSLWRYASIEELFKISITAVLANASVMAYLAIAQLFLPRSIHVMAVLLDMMLIGGVRFSYRAARSYRDTGVLTLGHRNQKRVMIVGAGEAGAMIIKELRSHGYRAGKPVCVVDDDASKIGRNLMNVPVLGGREDIPELVKKKAIDEIILAIPTAYRKEMREIVDIASRTGAKLKTIPGVYELIDGQVSIKEIRDVEIEDLLGRNPVHLDMELISGYLEGKRILITGGGGSIGSELCRQIAAYKPEKLIMLDIYENHLYDLQQELRKNFPQLPMQVCIASVRDLPRIRALFQEEKPAVVFHAAAHKHVPLMEDNPAEAIKNNVMGTKNVALCAHETRVEKFVMISTDKAVNPTNIMGASKRLSEMVVQALNEESETEFVSVRFGNVLGSSGSVIPLFKKQITEGGPITVTHCDMTRYFMTIPEAVQLVIQAGGMAQGGEVFVLDMGEPVKIMDLAENLIRLSGFEPGEDIEIEVTGLRPGEKLFEELLLNAEGLEATLHEKIFVEKPPIKTWQELESNLQHLMENLDDHSNTETKEAVHQLVDTYQPKMQERGRSNFRHFCGGTVEK